MHSHKYEAIYNNRYVSRFQLNHLGNLRCKTLGGGHIIANDRILFAILLILLNSVVLPLKDRLGGVARLDCRNGRHKAEDARFILDRDVC